MASVNRQYNDHKILDYLKERHDLSVPGVARSLDIAVDFDPPIGNAVRQATVSISFEITLDANEADEMLDRAR